MCMPNTPVLLNTGMVWYTRVIVEVAKALGGSFKLVTLAPRTVREMTQQPKETQKNGDTNKSF